MLIDVVISAVVVASLTSASSKYNCTVQSTLALDITLIVVNLPVDTIFLSSTTRALVFTSPLYSNLLK